MVKLIIHPNGKQEFVQDPQNPTSFMDAITRVDSLPDDYESNENFQKNIVQLQTHDGSKIIGYMIKFVVMELYTNFSDEFNKVFELDFENNPKTLKFKSDIVEKRNEQLQSFAIFLRDHSSFQGVKAWRDEKYCVYVDKIPYVLVERSLAGLLGILTYGVHINGYTFDPQTDEIKFWVPRRSKTKPTWPYMLDNIIAGGVGHPYGFYETVLKESMEEANLDEEVIKNYLKSVGCVTYFHYPKKLSTDAFQTEDSLIVGECEHLFDLKLPYDIIPKPNDGEVDSFNLMSLQEILDALESHDFKPNCGLVMVDFLIRHGYITAANEPNYFEIIQKMHRKLPFPARN